MSEDRFSGRSGSRSVPVSGGIRGFFLRPAGETLLLGISIVFVFGAVLAFGQAGPPSAEALTQWRYYQKVLIPASVRAEWAARAENSSGPPAPGVQGQSMPGEKAPSEASSAEPTKKGQKLLVDFLLNEPVFDGARRDLADLRLYDRSGREVPYALRVLRTEVQERIIPHREFNRLTDRPHQAELSLELLEQHVEHNRVRFKLQGMGFRRRAEVEGSEDATQWRRLGEKNLFRFRTENQSLEDVHIAYPASRFRFLRVKVQQDQCLPNDRPGLEGVEVLRWVEMAGETVWRDTALNPREPTRTPRGPASAWLIPLGGKNIPCEQLELTILEPEFVRDFEIQCWERRGYVENFYTIFSGTLQRQSQEQPQPLRIAFPEVVGSQLRLVIIDHRNPPLGIERIRVGSSARQVIFAWTPDMGDELRLYYGNPQAEAPNYDFAKNLPARLDPAPVRTVLGVREENPNYVPPPVPVSERWPWLIYVVFGAVSLLLAVCIVAVGRETIARVDADLTNSP